jgi:hypothetical protein
MFLLPLQITPLLYPLAAVNDPRISRGYKVDDRGFERGNKR